MRAVVFGGSGFLGSHVADCLTEEGHEVIIYDKQASTYMNGKQTMVIGDILDSESVEKTVKDCDYVFHFAGLSDLDDASDKPIETVHLNILATVHILESCKKNDIKRFVYASTFHVYSEKGGFYRCSKQAAELYIEEYSRKYGLAYTILRYGSLYGPRANRSNGVYRYLYQALKDKKIKCRGSGQELREYIHVRDAASLTVKALNEEFKNKNVILTGHYPMRVMDLLNMINDIVETPANIVYENGHSEMHYNMTPYHFKPKTGLKMVSNCYNDMGQGLLECIEEIHEGLLDKDDLQFTETAQQ